MDRNAWFIGLFALAYLYLDTSPPLAKPEDSMDEMLRYGSGDPLRLFPPGAADELCPRHLAHVVLHREDGAIWCRGCDEAFYPEKTIWEAVGVG